MTDQTTAEHAGRLWRALRIVGVNGLAFLVLGVYGEVSTSLEYSGNTALEIVGIAMFAVVFIIFGIPLMIMTFTIRPSDFAERKDGGSNAGG